MTEQKIEIKLPKNDETFLWKYLDLHKFISLICKKKLFFTRLDSFDDPMEGVTTKLLRKYAMADEPFDPNSSKATRRQERNYVNCWFTSQSESMAMWNLYSNKDSVAIKVEFSLLKKELEKSLKEFGESNPNLIILGESIEYLQLNPFDTNLCKQGFKYSALKKDNAYIHENEYRLLINSVKIREEHRMPFYEVPFKLDELRLTVLTHPNMQPWQIENIKELVKLTNTKIKIEKSSIMLK